MIITFLAFAELLKVDNEYKILYIALIEFGIEAIASVYLIDHLTRF